MAELPDAEMLAINWLKDDAAFDALLGPAPRTGRVVWRIPENPVFPLLVVKRTGGPESVPGWLDGARLQFDAWGATPTDKRNAFLLAQKTRESLNQLVNQIRDEGVVTGVDDVVGPRWEPDPDTKRARYIFESTLHVHPPQES